MPENAIQNVCEKVFSGVSAIINIETEKRKESFMKTINEIQQKINEGKNAEYVPKMIHCSSIDECKDIVLKMVEREIEEKIREHQYAFGFFKNYYIKCPQDKEEKETEVLLTIRNELVTAGYMDNGIELEWSEKYDAYRIAINILLYSFSEKEIKQLCRLQKIREKMPIVCCIIAFIILGILIILRLFGFIMDPAIFTGSTLIGPLSAGSIYGIVQLAVETKEIGLVERKIEK